MTRWRAAAAFLILMAIGVSVGADTRREIEHLLGFIGSSDCTFVRNGEEHDAPDARAHIERKYDYAMRWIETAEQFIKYTATKSSTTGEPYHVICAGSNERSSQWLTRELARYRASATETSGR